MSKAESPLPGFAGRLDSAGRLLIACRMHYNVGRNGEQLGKFSEEEIRAGLFEGRYLATDLGWTEGMTDWEPLGKLFAAPPVMPTGPTKPFPAYDPRNVPATPVSSSGASSGLAITAMVLGILSLGTCGLLGVGAIAAIVCGHLALSRINQSQGTVGGRGMAMSGLIMGYISLALSLLFMASLAIPTFAKIQEKGNQTTSMSNARQIVTYCNLYASDHEGKFPESMEELMKSGLIADKKILSEPPGDIAYNYFGAGMNNETPADAVVLTGSPSKGAIPRHVVARKDASVTLEKVSEEH